MRDVSTTILAQLQYLPVCKNKNVKIGIIGAGRIAQQRQIPAYRHAGLEVVAVADIEPTALERARSQQGIEHTYADYRHLLDHKDIDIVDICTNTFPRKQITLDALDAGKHVLSEKPFARSVKDAEEMVERADEAGVALAIHQPTRWYYPCAVAKALLDQGYLGELFYAEFRLHGDQDTSYYLDPVTRWHTELTDHIFVEWGAHFFDLARWFAGQKTPDSVFACGTDKGNEHFDSKMSVAASARFAHGLVASFSLNQATRFFKMPYSGMTFRLEGTQGTATGDMLGILHFASRQDKGIEAHFDWTARLSTKEDPYAYLWTASIRDGHLWPMVELINAIHEDRQAVCSGRDNIDTVRTYLAAQEADRQNRPVDPHSLKKRNAQ